MQKLLDSTKIINKLKLEGTMNLRLLVTLTICTFSTILMAGTSEKILNPGESINISLVKKDYKKVSCGNGETPECVVYSSSGGFQINISGKNEYRSSNFQKIARNIKAYQRQGKCKGVVISRVHSNPKELILYNGQSLFLDFSRGIESVACRPLSTIIELEQCYITTHPISAASLYYRDFTLDTSSAFLRDDYRSLESKYSKILFDIGLCSL